MSKHILIAGGAGFVGSNLAIAFKTIYPNYLVTVFDNLSRKGSALNLVRLEAADVIFRHVDTRMASDLVKDTRIDVIIDAAAEPSVLAGNAGNTEYLVQTNFNGTVNLLNLAKKHQAGFIFLSTSRVYPIASLRSLQLEESDSRFFLSKDQTTRGSSAEGIAENFILTGNRSLYGATKLASELMIAEYHALFGISTIINRCGVIAGPWQMGKVDQGVAVLWMASHFWKMSLQYLGFAGSGKQVRDLLHIDDLFTLVDKQVHHIEQYAGETYNVGGGSSHSISLLEMTAICEKISGNKTTVHTNGEARPGDIPLYITNNHKIATATGWKPTKAVDVLFGDIFNWIRKEEKTLKPVLGRR